MQQETASPIGDWNVVVTAYPQGGRPAMRALRRLGRTSRSGHYNVLLATVDDPLQALDSLELEAASQPVLIDSIARVAPALACFHYAADEDFERQALAAARPWLPQLSGKSFHVRIHPRGAGLAGHSQDIERRIGAAMISTFGGSGEAPRIDFDDPDFILTIDAIHGRAGLGLWSRQQMQRHPFLRPD